MTIFEKYKDTPEVIEDILGVYSFGIEVGERRLNENLTLPFIVKYLGFKEAVKTCGFSIDLLAKKIQALKEDDEFKNTTKE